jgi:hypothetical protein
MEAGGGVRLIEHVSPDTATPPADRSTQASKAPGHVMIGSPAINASPQPPESARAMPQISHFKTPCPEHINSQILQMVVDNLTDISMVAIPPSNLLYNVYQYAIGYEVHLYLEALNGAKGIDVELLVATDLDDPDKVIGFLLYLPVKDDPEACGVAYMAVDASHRRQALRAKCCGRWSVVTPMPN